MDSWTRVRAVFEAARDVSVDQRGAFLDVECEGDDELRAAVVDLLACDVDDTFLTAPEPQTRREVLAPTLTSWPSGAAFAGFEILGVLGSGGSGTVYEAQQSEPRRRVALKVLQAGTVTSRSVARFRWEAELLARLRHPAISQVYASGVELDEAGADVPWLALELVEGGAPITSAVKAQSLGRRDVLALFAEVCDAVQHGHQHGVIHRDLKPANVLLDSEGHPKVIDFGVARVLADDAERTRFTQTGELIGTLQSMSPEQLSGDGDHVDARTDVYALGALLHELLCDAPLHDFRGASLTEIAQRIREVRPQRPSTVRAGIHEDLDWVVTQAVAAEPDQRYASASELAADVRRFLAREPVLAGPPGAGYRLRSFVRRHRFGVLATLAVALVLIAGLIGTTAWMLIAQENERLAHEQRDRAEDEQARADKERARAEQEAALATAVTDFVVGLVRSPDPALDGNDVRVVDVLARADDELHRTLAGQPDLAASLHVVLGRLHYNLGLSDGAEHHFTRALSFGDAGTPVLSLEEALTTRAERGAVRREAGRYEEAESDIQSVLAERRSMFGDDHVDTGRSLAALAHLHHARGDTARAEELYLEALDVLERHAGPTDEYVLRTQANLAGLYQSMKRWDDAEAILVEAVPHMREQLGTRHFATLTALSNLASLSVALEKYARSAEVMDEVISIRRATLPPDHPDLLAGISNLAVLRFKTENYADAARLTREVLDARAANTPRAPEVILARCNLMHILFRADDFDGIGEQCRALVALQLDAHAETPVPFGFIENIARFAAYWGFTDEATALARAGRDGRMRLTPSDISGRLHAQRSLTVVRAVAGAPLKNDFAELTQLIDALPAHERRGAIDHIAADFREFGEPNAANDWLALKGDG